MDKSTNGKTESFWRCSGLISSSSPLINALPISSSNVTVAVDIPVELPFIILPFFKTTPALVITANVDIFALFFNVAWKVYVPALRLETVIVFPLKPIIALVVGIFLLAEIPGLIELLGIILISSMAAYALVRTETKLSWIIFLFFTFCLALKFPKLGKNLTKRQE